MSIYSKPNTQKSRLEWDRIFKISKELPKPKYEDFKRYVPKIERQEVRQTITDLETGKPPSQRKLNKMYSDFKDLRENLKDQLCSKDEHWKPTEENIRKVQAREFGKGKERIQRFINLGKIVGVEPKDMNLERLRRGNGGRERFF